MKNKQFIYLQSRGYTVHKNVTSGGLYVMKELSLDKSLDPVQIAEFEKLTIKLHFLSGHASFYKDIDSSNSTKSEYHATVIFVDSQGLKYQLHAYFNEKDKPTSDPVLSEEISPNKYKPIPLNNKETFQSFATVFLSKFMSSLRNEYKKQIQRDFNHFAEIENQLDELSKSLKIDCLPYLNKLTEALAFLESALHSYHYDEEYFLGVETLFLKIKANIEKPVLSAHLESKREPSKPIKDKDEMGAEVRYVTFSEPTQKLSAIKNDFQEKVEEANQAFVRFINYKAYDPKKINLAHEAYRACSEVVLLASEDTDILTLDLLRSLIHKNQMEWQALLVNLLRNQKIDLASQLVSNNTHAKSLYNEAFISEQVKIALEGGLDKLLGFLFMHTSVPIHTLRAPGNLSLVGYCFMHDSPATPKLACLNILVKNGASLMEAHPKEEYPFAHVLLYTPGHPLRKSLFDNIEITLNNPYFFKSLIIHLERWKSLPLIATVIKAYQSNLNELKGCSGINNLQNKNNLLAQEIAVSNVPPEILYALKFDPEVSEAVAKYQLIKAKFSKEYPREASKGTKRATDMLHENTPSTSASLEHYKAVVLTTYIVFSAHIEKWMALQVCQRELKKWKNKNFTNLSNEQKFQIRQQAQLAKDVDELSRLIDSKDFQEGKILAEGTYNSETINLRNEVKNEPNVLANQVEGCVISEPVSPVANPASVQNLEYEVEESGARLITSKESKSLSIIDAMIAKLETLNERPMVSATSDLVRGSLFSIPKNELDLGMNLPSITFDKS